MPTKRRSARNTQIGSSLDIPSHSIIKPVLMSHQSTVHDDSSRPDPLNPEEEEENDNQEYDLNERRQETYGGMVGIDPNAIDSDSDEKGKKRGKKKNKLIHSNFQGFFLSAFYLFLFFFLFHTTYVSL